MEDREISTLINGTDEDRKKILQNFSEKNQQTFSFIELSTQDKRKRLWETLISILTDSSLKDCYVHCLNCVRLLSRDKTNLEDILEQKWISTLLRLSGLFPDDELSKNNNVQADYVVIIAAQKCLSNLLLNSNCAQAWCASSSSWCVSALVHRLHDHPQLPHELCLFDLKLLFLITALCEETRTRIREDFKGMKHLTEALERIIPTSQASYGTHMEINPENCALVCELLKILFNVAKGFEQRQTDEEEESQFMKLVPILCSLLMNSTQQQEELRGHCVNLLMTVPPSCYAELMPPFPKDDESELPKYNMKAIDVILEMLDLRLKEITPNASTSRHAIERLCPILQVLGGGALSHRVVRKYVRSQVLPPLREVHKRPEDVESMRGALCRLLTCPVSPVRDVVADFLFVLCKESVSRMVKHTGYGNCAGLLANRGLMLGGRGNRGHYSSESEDSDTEEYKEHREQINPVIGCCEPPHPNPMANMSEEQKEHEAMKIVDMLDKLTRSGVVLPGRIGEDGKPEPLEHVLQLQECLSNLPSNDSGDQSDSD